MATPWRCWSCHGLDARGAGGRAFDAPALLGRIEESFQRRLTPLPSATRLLLLVAAAEPVGDPVLCGVRPSGSGSGSRPRPGGRGRPGRVRRPGAVPHPLVRSAVYRSAPAEARHRVHQALAEATDPDLDPDRRAWHRAHATAGLDEDVAAELERSAGRAQARGGLAAAAAFLQRAAELTPEPTRRARRTLAAAQSKHQAGAPDTALACWPWPRPDRSTSSSRPVPRLRAQVTFAVNRGRDALRCCSRRPSGSSRSTPRWRARPTSTRSPPRCSPAAWLAAAGCARSPRRCSRRTGDSTRRSPLACDLLLDGLAVLTTQGYAAAATTLKRALRAFRDEPMSEEDTLRWLWLACRIARALGDDASWDELTDRQVQLARHAGALSLLPIALIERFGVQLFVGDLDAASLVAEAEAVAEATGSQLAPQGAIALAAWRGREAEASALIQASRQEVERRGEGLWLIATEWASAVLFNGLGRYEEALAAAEQAAEDPHELGLSTWVPTEIIEAAIRSGDRERAAGPSGGSRRSAAPVARTGRLGSRRVRERC